MCCGIVGQDLVVRVLDAEMPSVLRRSHVRPMDFTGKPLRGFVYVAPPGVATEDELLDWIRKGLAFSARHHSADAVDDDCEMRSAEGCLSGDA
jgi:hypothetical protein